MYTLSQPKQGRGKKRHEIKTLLVKEFADQLRLFPIDGEFQNITEGSEPYTHTHTPPADNADTSHTDNTENLPLPHDTIKLIQSYEFVANSALQAIRFHRELVSEKEQHIGQLERELQRTKQDKDKLESEYKRQLMAVLGDVQRWKSLNPANPNKSHESN